MAIGESIGEKAAETASLGVNQAVEKLDAGAVLVVTQLVNAGKALLDRLDGVLDRLDGATVHLESILTIRLKPVGK